MSEKKEPEVKEEEQQKSLADYLYSLPNAPTKEVIDQWKATFGDVFVSGFGEQEIFVFRALQRKEHREMQARLNDPQGPIDQFTYEEQVCDICVLYPPAPRDWEKKAGMASTLFEQIMLNSHFFSPQAASMMVLKL